MAQFIQTSLLRCCSCCGAWRSPVEFYRDARAADGIRKDCKCCCLARDRRRKSDPDVHAAYLAYLADYRSRHREKARATTSAYREEFPQRVRAAQQAYRARPENQITARERARAFRLANPDRRSEYERRRRAFKIATAIGFIEPAQLAAKFAFWGNRCWMCQSPNRLEVDHVKPLSKGGAHVLANLRPACGGCNRSKSDRWPLRQDELSGQHRVPGNRTTRRPRRPAR